MNRKAERTRLRAAAKALSPAWIADASAAIAQRLEQELPGLAHAAFAFTWPLPGEPDLRAAAERWVASGARASLPETTKGAALTFRPWTPGAPMRPGLWNIPVPDTAEIAHADVLLIPCLGYDAAGYRLGNGGGFYDRTLAALQPRPLAVGIGWSHAALASIGPEPHDIPMDLIVTEDAAAWHNPKKRENPLTKRAAIGI